MPIPPLRRVIVHGLSTFSLALCVLAAVLWDRSLRHVDQFSRQIGVNRYTLIFEAGRIALYGPPRLPRLAEARRVAAESLVSQIDNEQIHWAGRFAWPETRTVDVLEVECLNNSPAQIAEDAFTPDELKRPLLRALEGPRRFVIAHLLLARPRYRPGSYADGQIIKGQPFGKCMGDPEDHGHAEKLPGEFDVEGLKVRVIRWKNPDSTDRVGYTSLGDWLHDMEVDVDASQLSRIRDKWHRALDARMIAIPDWLAMGVAAGLPILNLTLRLRRRLIARKRTRSGQCLNCGYDLRGSLWRCPECGMACKVAKLAGVSSAVRTTVSVD